MQWHYRCADLRHHLRDRSGPLSVRPVRAQRSSRSARWKAFWRWNGRAMRRRRRRSAAGRSRSGFRPSRSATRRCGRPSACGANSPRPGSGSRTTPAILPAPSRTALRTWSPPSPESTASRRSCWHRPAMRPRAWRRWARPPACAIKVFLPAAAPVAKRIQVLQYGAELVSVDGTYDQAFDLSLEYSSKTGSLSRNTAYNPLTIEGKKTVAFEIVDDLLRAGCRRSRPCLRSGGRRRHPGRRLSRLREPAEAGPDPKDADGLGLPGRGLERHRARACRRRFPRSDPFGPPRRFEDRGRFDCRRRAAQRTACARPSSGATAARPSSCPTARSWRRRKKLVRRIGPVCRTLVERRLRRLAQGARSRCRPRRIACC